MRESQLNQKINKYLGLVVQEGGSDLHLSAGQPPIIRVDSKLVRLEKEDPLAKTDLETIVDGLLNEERKQKLEKEKTIDFSVEFESNIRFRANIFFQKGNLSLAMRLISNEIKGLNELDIPEIVYKFAEKKQGLFLVTGPTGHGKSTTLASLIDHLNHNTQNHIITIEDPIEYIFQSDQCLIDQREVFQDTADFPTALKACFREDVDVILLGEMRDLETIATAITAAETGHLILATLHTNDAIQTIDRIIDVFPAYQQNQIRYQLANVLIGVVSQRLLPKVGGGRIPAVEIMINNTAIENLIRQNQTHQIGMVMETSLDSGMISINRSLVDLVRKGIVNLEDAESFSTDIQSFRLLLGSLN